MTDSVRQCPVSSDSKSVCACFLKVDCDILVTYVIRYEVSPSMVVALILVGQDSASRALQSRESRYQLQKRWLLFAADGRWETVIYDDLALRCRQDTTLRLVDRGAAQGDALPPTRRDEEEVASDTPSRLTGPVDLRGQWEPY